MKMTTIISLFLIIIIVLSSVSVYAAGEESANVFYASEDSYIKSGARWEDKNYGDESNMLFGKTYNRTAFLKFDLTGADLSLYKGALLDVNVKTVSSSGSIDVYAVSSDWSEKKLTSSNAPSDYELIIKYNVTQAGVATVAFNISKAFERAKAEGKTEISLALKSDVGCINISSSENSDISIRPKLTLTEDNAYIKGQVDFEFPDITLGDIQEEMTKTISRGHPYIFATKEKVEKLKKYAFGEDELLTEYYGNVKRKADELLAVDIKRIPDNTSSQSYIGTGMECWRDAMNLGLAYLVEGDYRYAQRAYKQAEYLCGLDTWGTYQMIDNSQTALCVALTYDWCYDWMSAQQKEVLVSGLRRLHLDTMSDLLKNPSKPEYRWSLHQATFSGNNHAVIDCSFAFISAMSIAETDFNFFTDLMVMTARQLEKPFSNWYPDSAWFEGVGYWNYAGKFTATYLLSLESAFGHCLGYENIDCIMNVADFPIYAQSDLGGFVYTDSDEGVDCLDPLIYSLGYLKKDIALQKYALDNCVKSGAVDPIFVLNYNPQTDYNSASLDLTLDKLFRNTDIVTMRNTFDGNQSTWAAMGVQKINRSGGMMSNGSIGFDAFGDHWILNHGKETYYSDYWDTNKRWTYYRTRPEANSCLVIDPSELGGQNFDGEGSVDVFKSGKGSAFAITDLALTYAGQVESYMRGIMLTNNRNSLVVQDEFVLTKPSEVYSFFNIYKAEIEICEDGRSAIVTKGNKKMKVTVECDKDFEFGFMKSEPLPTSPVPAYPNSYNREHKKLVIHFNETEGANIRVTFTPYLCEEELSAVDFGEFIPMSEWTVTDEIKKAPILSDLKLNGKTIEGFNPADRCYISENEFDASSVTPVYDTSKYDMKISFDESTCSAYILLIDKNDAKNMNSYTITIPVVRQPNFVDTKGMDELSIANITAPVPQTQNGIENMFDGDLSTRWSAEGAGTVMDITLDKVREVGCLGFNHYEGDTGRIQYFDVHLSTDGTNWEKFEMFESSGVTNAMEYYDLKNTKAKYIKIIYNAVNNGSWNSVCELRIFGK